MALVLFLVLWPKENQFLQGEDTRIIAHVPTQRINVQVVINLFEANLSLAHYTEHLAWLNAIGNDRDADRHSNAWTNRYAVGYWLSGEAKDLPSMLSNLRGVFDTLNLPERFAHEEKDIVLREYEFRIAGTPSAKATEAVNAFLYAGNSIAKSVIGTPAQINGFTYEQAKALHAETHRPQNAVLVVTGDVTERQLNRAMSEAGWPDGVPVADVLAPPAFALASSTRERFEIVDPNAAPSLIWRRVVTLPEPVQFDLLEAQTALLADILRANLPGGVAGPLRFDATIARSFDIRIWPIDEDNIEIEFVSAPDRGVSLAAVEQAFSDTLSEIAASGIPEETFTRVLARFEHFWPDWDDADETAHWMADYTVGRVSILRKALSERDLKRLEPKLSFASTNQLLRILTGEGRTATAFIGAKEDFE